MYILLRGKVTIYIDYAAKKGPAAGDDEEEEKEKKPVLKPGQTIRDTLGTFVTSLGKDSTGHS